MNKNLSLIFVTGASRSGTTMLNRVLGGHSSVFALNELHYFGDLCDVAKLDEEVTHEVAIQLAGNLVARQTRGIWGGTVNEGDRAEAEKLIQKLPEHSRTGAQIFAHVLAWFVKREGKTSACEQTPRNIYYAPQLLKTYPNAKIVHMVRDPRAVLASQKNRWRRKILGGANTPYSEMIRVWANYHPVTLCKLWLKANQQALRLADHPRVFSLRFEDVVEQPEGTIKRLCGFLEISYENAMLDVPQVGSSHRTNKAERGISKEGLNGWEQVLKQGEVILCEKTTKKLMQHFSYTPSWKGHSFSIWIIPQLILYPLHILGVLLTNPRRAWIQFSAILR